ncbi:MAG: tetratricopeptide repeat protein [Gammaproteobacteria bacterium]|nr:tetratricopeptide repeat protein [Gammaproteobacteria bacterium]
MSIIYLPAHAADLREVKLLIEAGATSLAQIVLDKEQPALLLNPEEWLEWERQRVALYKQSSDWKKLIERLSHNPKWVPVEFSRWSQEQIAQAQIEQKDTDAALTTLRKLIWNNPGNNPASISLLPAWRQMVIQAYLLEGNISDAEVAMLRYQQDNVNPNEEWKRLRATVLILAGKPYDAQLLVEKDTHMHSRTIFYLAQLNAGKKSAKKIWKRVRTLARNKKFSKTTRRQFWVVVAKAAQKANDYRSAIGAMQVALLLKDVKRDVSREEKLLFAFNGDDVWRLYEHYGRILGNKWQLLIGNDEAWFSKASNLVDKQPMQAMALFAVLIKDAVREQTRVVAHNLFASLMAKRQQGLSLLSYLYLQDSQKDKVAYIPEDLRHKLIDKSLAQSDIKTASRLTRTLNEPPEGADIVFWKMRRARILILAGQLDEGIKALQNLVKTTPVFEPQQMDRLLQVLFDLQTVGRHKEAIRLFTSLPMEGQSGQLRREVLYWIADSYKHEKQFITAARYYLLSAGLLDAKSMDPWAQTARYHAADVLLEGKSYADAGRIYKRLLDITKEKSRRVVLKNKIQQIWLESNQQTPAKQK